MVASTVYLRQRKLKKTQAPLMHVRWLRRLGNTLWSDTQQHPLLQCTAEWHHQRVFIKLVTVAVPVFAHVQVTAE